MASTIGNAKITGLTAFLPAAAACDEERFQQAYEQNRHRVYALAFWITNDEIVAEELMRHTFCRVFAGSGKLSADAIDLAFIAEVRQLIPLGVLSLAAETCTEVANVRRNTLRVHLEQAVVQVPPTERMIFLLHDAEAYDHARIARLLGISQDESRYGLHQARLRIRELVASMRD